MNAKQMGMFGQVEYIIFGLIKYQCIHNLETFILVAQFV